jgi:hypothetical protein
MRLLLLSILAQLFVSTATAEPIDDLVGRLSADHLWQNGASAVLDLPKEASSKQVVGKTFDMWSFASGRVKHFTIIKQAEVRLPGSLPDVYTAILVQTDLGTKIVLLQYHEPPIGWWSRVYDAPPAKQAPLEAQPSP